MMTAKFTLTFWNLHSFKLTSTLSLESTIFSSNPLYIIIYLTLYSSKDHTFLLLYFISLIKQLHLLSLPSTPLLLYLFTYLHLIQLKILVLQNNFLVCNYIFSMLSYMATTTIANVLLLFMQPEVYYKLSISYVFK